MSETTSEPTILFADGSDVLDPADVRRMLRAGALVRIKRGAYAESSVWSRLDDRRRHLLLMHAVARSHRGAVFGYESAAALLGFSLLGGWPADVHLIASRASGGRSERWIRRHCVGIDAEDVIGLRGLQLSSACRTVLDIARSRTFDAAVVMADSALACEAVSVDELAAGLERLGPRGAARARRVLAFSDHRSESPGESLSRVRFHQLGFPPPQLQREFVSGSGHRYMVDFFWPEFGLVGEFDGKGKYLREDFLRGRTPAEAVIEEKKREDRIRLDGVTFARWGWAEAMRPESLARILAAAGLPAPRRRGASH